MSRIRKIVKLMMCIIIMFFGVLTVSEAILSNKEAFATGTVEVDILQSKSVFYRGANYLTNNKFTDFISGEGFGNDLYDALLVTVNGATANIPHDDFTIESTTPLIQPKSYNTTIKVNYNNVIYTKNVIITLSKAQLFVRAKVNLKDSLVIDEGVPYFTSIVYDGFVGSDNINTLEIPAIIVQEPKRPISNYEIVAGGAKSNLYEFVYVGATITINSNPLSKIKSAEGDIDTIILEGQYSPYCDLDFINVGISPANSLYVKIKQDLVKFYANSSIYDSYKETEAYSINLLIDGIKEENVSSTVSIKLPQKSMNKDKYLVVALYNNGTNEVITGIEKDGYLTFDVVDMGSFVIFTPVEGLKTTVLIALCIGLVGGFILIIILVSIFRRKY